RGRPRLLEVPEPRPRDRRRATPRPDRARGDPRPPARAGAGAARPHLRARSLDAQPLHARRDDRQQLCGTHSVMSEFHGPGPLTADQVVELEVLTYRGERFRVGRDGNGAPEELAAKLHDLATRYGDRVRERYPDIPRRVSGYNLDRLLPENGFQLG